MTLLQRRAAVTIRPAKPEDARRIAALCGQLGYPATSAEIRKRLAFVMRDLRSTCFVAETPDEGVIGWVQVGVTPLLEADRRVEVNGLIVDERVRSRGAGWLLLTAAERWARKMKCKSVSVRSNIIRERAHSFYQKHDYEHYKTQKAFRKPL